MIFTILAVVVVCGLLLWPRKPAFFKPDAPCFAARADVTAPRRPEPVARLKGKQPYTLVRDLPDAIQVRLEDQRRCWVSPSSRQ